MWVLKKIFVFIKVEFGIVVVVEKEGIIVVIGNDMVLLLIEF